MDVLYVTQREFCPGERTFSTQNKPKRGKKRTAPPPPLAHWSSSDAPISPQKCHWLDGDSFHTQRPLPPCLWWSSMNGSSPYPSKTNAPGDRLIGLTSRLTSGRNTQRSLDSLSLREQKKRRFPNRVLYLFLCFQRVQIITATYTTGILFIVFVRIHNKTG